MRVLALVAIGALASCVASGDRISYVEYEGYSGADLAEAITHGPIPLRVFCAPSSGVTSEAAAVQIASAMAGAYTTAPKAGYTMVVRFGDGAPSDRLCGEAVAASAGTDYGTAFCKDGQALSYLDGNVGTSSIYTPAFRVAMASAANELLPIENPEFVGCDNNRLC
ncbi:MAG: hypothetical protein ACKVH0_17775 [Alphaproteobacteria bacterium]